MAMTTKWFRLASAGLLLLALGAATRAEAQDYFVGEMRWVAFNFAPKGWATCDGQILSISQNTALFSLLGTQFGGDGKTTFALPDVRGRAPVHQGQGPGLSLRTIGEKVGTETVTLTTGQIPAHTHQLKGTSNIATAVTPTSNVAAAKSRTPLYGAASNLVNMSPGAIDLTGGGQAHENMPPYLVLNCVIALQGIFPPRN